MSPLTRTVLVRTPSPAFRALINHCSECKPCNTDTSTACPEAARLRRVWSRTQRKAHS